MKILYVHQSFGSLGGAESNVYLTASQLQKRGHQVSLLTQQGSGQNETAWLSLFQPYFFKLCTNGLSSALRNFQPDVLYVHKWEHLPSLQLLLASGVPAIRMVHDHDIYCMRSYKYNPLTRRICHRPASAYCVFPCLANFKRQRTGFLPFRWVSYFEKRKEIALQQKFDRLLTVTNYMRQELEQNGMDPKRIEILTPTPMSKNAVHSTFSERNLLLYAGQITRGKGVDALLHALALVQSPFEAVILGDGNYRRYCEKLCHKLSLQTKVAFKGFVSQKEMEEYYRDASMLLICSVWPEPLPTIGLEAMLHGLPAVAFDVGGISDWLEEGRNGHRVPWMDTRAYAARIDELLRNKEKARQMGAQGLTIVQERYNFDTYLERLENIFQNVHVRQTPHMAPSVR